MGNPTPDIDAVASQGLILTWRILNRVLPQPAPRFSPDNTHPPRHSDAANVRATGRSARVTTLPQLLHDQGYVTQAIGKCIWGKTKSRSRRTLALMISAL